jgi:hypothetical protein
MARPVSAAAAKMRAAKTQKTKDAKRRASLEDMGLMTERKVFRKPRKPMSDEQKAAAAERLEKARAAKGPSKNVNYAEEVRNLPSDNIFSLDNVKKWLATSKELLSAMKTYKDSKESSEREKYRMTEAYITNLENYLRTGIYCDLFYGEHQQNKIKYVSVRMSYHADGTPKRTEGVFYPDIGVYTKEMELEDAGNGIFNKDKVLKTSGRSRTKKAS